MLAQLNRHLLLAHLVEHRIFVLEVLGLNLGSLAAGPTQAGYRVERHLGRTKTVKEGES